MTTNVTHLPCDLDVEPFVVPAPPLEPDWHSDVTASLFIDGGARIDATMRTASNGATYLDVTFEPRHGGRLSMSLSNAAQAVLAKAIAAAMLAGGA